MLAVTGGPRCVEFAALNPDWCAPQVSRRVQRWKRAAPSELLVVSPSF